MDSFLQGNSRDQDNFLYKKRRKRSINDESDEEMSSRSKLLYISPSPALYHAEGIASAPYAVKAERSETLYVPVVDTIFVNTQVYDEVLVRSGVYFLADDKGVYEKTVEGILYYDFYSRVRRSTNFFNKPFFIPVN